MVEFLQFALSCIRAYRIAKKTKGIGYSSIVFHDVQKVAVFVGLGREAWRVSVLATESLVVREES